jgi:peptide/nickel transport system substrate-binding protein
MVGVGPFKFSDFQRDVLVKVVRSDGYYEKDKPFLDSIVTLGCPDYTTKILAFKAGSGQFVSDIRPSDVASLQAEGATISRYDVSACFGLMPSSANKDSPWSDIRVRQAAQYAIDTKTLANTIYGFSGEGTTQAATPKDPFYVQGLDRPYNTAKAKELLASAGYANGFKTTFYVDNTLQNAQNYGAAVQSYLKAVGIDVSLELCDMPKLSALKTQGWNGILDAGSLITGLAGFNQLFSVYPRTTSLISMARPAGFQDQIDAAMSESDDASRTKLYQGLIKAMFDDCTYVLTYAQYLMFAMTPAVHDMAYGKNFPSYWEPQNAWLSAK